jgi:hypothetical protein
MQKKVNIPLVLFVVFLFCPILQASAQQPDPLPSWNEGNPKQAIISYVTKITDSTGNSFIPVKDRIATFDNDGTLWAERPYVQELFAFYQVKELVKKNPSLRTKQPFKAVLENDKAYFSTGGEKAMLQLVAATHTGMTEDEFEASVKGFFFIRYLSRPQCAGCQHSISATNRTA